MRDDILLAPPASLSSVLVEAIRCWRLARDSGQPSQPCLFRLLVRSGRDMLAPVFDGLIAAYEQALDRPIMTGSSSVISRDEERLVYLVENADFEAGTTSRMEGLRRSLQCAICSTRIMMKLSDLEHVDQRRLCPAKFCAAPMSASCAGPRRRVRASRYWPPISR